MRPRWRSSGCSIAWIGHGLDAQLRRMSARKSERLLACWMGAVSRTHDLRSGAAKGIKDKATAHAPSGMAHTESVSVLHVDSAQTYVKTQRIQFSATRTSGSELDFDYLKVFLPSWVGFGETKPFISIFSMPAAAGQRPTIWLRHVHPSEPDRRCCNRS